METVAKDPELSLDAIKCLCGSDEEGYRSLSSLELKEISIELYKEILESKKCSDKECENEGVIVVEEKLYCRKHEGDKLCCKCQEGGEKFLDYANEWVCSNCNKKGKCVLADIEIPEGKCNKKTLFLHAVCKDWICEKHLIKYSPQITNIVY
eukprot:TRINITY_DN6115_c0_g2_i1.p1 TRINITY_DN6115_c0_g2~~TRINITY_DN6115_c0_g2_i1.p1  ORF type:complete len:152 (-),score=39.34 TRINITY_DN6115_c0_g2_i1:257-712(-)